MQKKINRRLPKKNIFLIILLIIILIYISTTFVIAQTNVVVVEANVLNVRVGPGLSHSVMDQAVTGEQLNVIDEENEWYKVRLADDQVGWVASWLVDNTEPAAYENTLARVTHPQANIRLYGTTDSEILGTVYEGTELEVLYTENNWVQVQYMGTLGWVREDLVEVYESFENEQAPQQEGSVDTLPISEAVIVLDAGHGGSDPGALAPNFYEKHITMETTQRLYNRLQDAGATVLLTRSGDEDVSLDERTQLSNHNDAHAFISIHYDSTSIPNSKSGTTTYYYQDQDFLLAETINAYLTANGLLQNNGVHFGDYQVLRENTQPSILLELGYLNNDNDVSIVYTEEYQSVVVEAIYQGLLDYFGS